MAEPLNLSLIPETLGGVLGAIGTFVLGLLMWTTHRKKGKIDESALVLAEWKNLFEAHQKQMNDTVAAHHAQMTSIVATHQGQMQAAIAEITTLRREVSSLRDRVAVLENENREYRDENEGLRRQLAQASRSQAVMLAPSVASKSPTANKRFGLPEDQQELLRKIDEKDAE